YNATLAQARAGDSGAIDRLAGDATAYVNAARSYYGTSADYADLVAQVRAALADEVALLQTGGPNATPAASSQQATAVMQSNMVLSNQIAAQNVTIDRLTRQLADLAAQLQRAAVNRAA